MAPNRRAKILVAENTKLGLQNITDCLESHGYAVRAAQAPEEALSILQSEWIHAAIIDFRLRDDADLNDFSGLEVIRDSDRLVPKILLTGFKSEFLEKAFDHWRDEVTLDGHVWKSEPNTTLLEKLQAVLDKAKLDLTLDIQFSPGFSLLSLADRIAGRVYRHDAHQLGIVADELSDLYRKLFAGRQAIAIGWLLPELDSTFLTLAQPQARFGPQTPLVVQCGPRAAIHKIYANWKSYVEPYLHDHAVYLQDFAETLHYAALAFRVEQAGEFRPLASLIRNNAPQSDLLNVVERVSRMWSAPSYEPAAASLVNLYPTHLDPAELRNRLSGWLKSLLSAFPNSLLRMHPERKVIAIQPHGGKLELPDPTEPILAALTPAASPAVGAWLHPSQPFLSIAHGDLRTETVLVGPENQIWLCGSVETGPAFYIRDFVSLEADFVFGELSRIPLAPESAARPAERVLEALRAWLTPDTLDDPMPQPDSMAANVQRILAAASSLREGAGRWRQAPDIRLYYAGLLMQAIHEVIKAGNVGIDTHRQEGRSRIAALATVLLYDRLARWPSWETLSLPKNPLRLVPPNRVFVPHLGEQELDPQPYRLLEILYTRPNQAISRAEIVEQLWPGDSGYDRSDALDVVVYRLRHVIEENPKAGLCRYLVTVPRRGLELRPDGRKTTPGP